MNVHQTENKTSKFSAVELSIKNFAETFEIHLVFFEIN